MTRAGGRSTRLLGAGGIAIGAITALGIAVAAGAPGGGRKPPRPSPTPVQTVAPSPRSSFGPGTGLVTGVVAVSPVTVSIELLPAVAVGGRHVTVRVTVVNQARTTVARVVVAVAVVPIGLSLKGPKDRSIAGLPPGAAKSLAWNACAGTAGTYALVATAEVAGARVTSASQVLTVTSDGRC